MSSSSDTNGVALAASLNPQTKLLEMRRQMFTVQQSLEQGKRDSIIREAAFAQKEEQVRKRDLELQQTFIKMDSVVQENNAKKDRADRRGIEEAKTAAQKMKEIVEGQASLDELKQEVAQLEHSKSKLQKHHDFLSRYQSMHSQDFPEISTILDRFTMLQSAQKDLLTEQGRLLEEVEQKRRDLARLQKARSTHALNAENVTGKIRDRLEATRALGLRLLQGADDATAERAERVNELGTTLLATNNLYFRCTTGPYGNVIKHHKNDAEVLGVGAGKLGESLGFTPWHSDVSKEGAEESATSTSEGKEHENKDDLNTTISAAVKAGAAGDEGAITKVAEAISGMAPEAVVEKLRRALSSLIVVGSYLVDYSAILNERNAWLNEQRRLREEKDEKEALAKEEEAEKQRQKEKRMAAAAAAASNKKGNATSHSSPTKIAPVSSSTLISSPPPFSPIKSSTTSSSSLGGTSSSGLSASASALLFGGIGSSMPGSAAAATATLNAIGAQGGIPGLGGRLAAALQKQGGPRTYVVSSTINLPTKIDAQVPILSSKTVAILTGTDKNTTKIKSSSALVTTSGGGGGGDVEDSKSTSTH